MELGRKVAAATATVVLAMSPAAVHKMKQHEGTGPTVRTSQGLIYRAYPDPYLGWGTPTICYGHTLNVKRGDTATQSQCDMYLQQDVQKHCAIIQPTPKTQGELDAYCSFAYNTGRFKTAPSVYNNYIKGDYWAACAGIRLYYYSNGKPSDGLRKRREDEYQTCIKDLPPKGRTP